MFDDAGSVGHIFCFGRFRLSPQKRVLLSDSIPVPLGSRAFDILIQLVERHGELVSNEELIARTWPKTTVVQAKPGRSNERSTPRPSAMTIAAERYILNEPCSRISFRCETSPTSRSRSRSRPRTRGP